MLNMNYVDETDFLQEENYLFNIQGEGIKKAFATLTCRLTIRDSTLRRMYSYSRDTVSMGRKVKSLAG